VQLFHDNWLVERRTGSTPPLVCLFVVEMAALLVNATGEHLARWRRTPTRLHGSSLGPPGERMKSIRFLFQDMRYAMRALLKRPGFTTIAALTLALGIGANAAIFSVVHAVLLVPLPYENEDELVMIWGELRARGVTDWPASHPDVRDYFQAESFDEVAAVVPFQLTLTGGDGPERVEAAQVTTNFHPVLGVRPLLGRLFNPDDTPEFRPDPNDPTAPRPIPAVLLSHGLWQRRFGSDPDVVGRSIDMMGLTVNIVGVLPSDFKLFFPTSTNLPRTVDLWLATRIDLQSEVRRNVMWRVVARLKPDVSVNQAQAEMETHAARLRQELQLYTDVGYHIEVVPLRADLVEPVRPLVLALFGAVGFVLLIACANVANLLLVRATTRSREISVRAALGGSRWQLIRQMLSESLVLSLLGAALGLALAQASVRVLVAMRPAELPRIDSIEINGVVLGFTLAASFVAALIFGIIPALHASRANLADALTTRMDGGGGSRQRALRGGLVVLEVALSLVLLIGAGLMLRSTVALTRIDPGYNPNNLLTFRTAVPPGVLRGAEARATFYRELRERLAGLPGVLAVGTVRPLPLSNLHPSGRYGTEAALTDESLFGQAAYSIVTAGFFESMETRVVAGRVFNAIEHNDSIPVVVVDEVLARKLWPNQSAVGRQLYVRMSNDPFPAEVVGVVEHQRHEDLSREGRETVYFPSTFWGSPLGGSTWTVRTANDPLSLVSVVRREVAAMNSDIPLTDVRTMKSYVDAARAPTRFALVLIGVFGVSAMLLASVGLYGVLAYAVQQRTAEIGIRMAFGAHRTAILTMVGLHGMRLVLTGIGLGLLGAYGLTRFMDSLLVGIPPTDPVTYAGIVLLFTVVSAIACYLPAHRATRVDPVEALREA
jgi:putative ABC transport system permease protein